MPAFSINSTIEDIYTSDSLFHDESQRSVAMKIYFNGTEVAYLDGLNNVEASELKELMHKITRNNPFILAK